MAPDGARDDGVRGEVSGGEGPNRVQEPSGAPCIVLAAGRPFPPPRARPVISGVVDICRLRPCLLRKASALGRRHESELLCAPRGSSASLEISQNRRKP